MLLKILVVVIAAGAFAYFANLAFQGELSTETLRFWLLGETK